MNGSADLELFSFLPERRPDAHKGTYGHVLLLAGSRGMAGAALLSGEAAYRTGCGLVAVAGPEENRVILQSALPEALYRDYCEAEDLAGWADACGIGPGIGTSADALCRMRKLIRAGKGPLILDADALNLLAANPGVWNDLDCGRPVVITPHPKEMSRLTGLSVRDIAAGPAACAADFAGEHGVICVLKGHWTVISDGSRTIYNHSGCDGMATGGSGDVLTGILASLAAQAPQEDLFQLTRLGVYLHGLAGEAAAASLGSRSMLARDIIGHLPGILREL